MKYENVCCVRSFFFSLFLLFLWFLLFEHNIRFFISFSYFFIFISFHSLVFKCCKLNDSFDSFDDCITILISAIEWHLIINWKLIFVWLSGRLTINFSSTFATKQTIDLASNQTDIENANYANANSAFACFSPYATAWHINMTECRSIWNWRLHNWCVEVNARVSCQVRCAENA